MFFTILGQAQNTINAWSESKILNAASTTFHFVDVESSKIIASHNAQKLLNPASTLKLLTSLIYLEEKGDSYRHKTTVGYKGKLSSDGVLHGDIIVNGSGDASFGSARYGNQHNLPSLTTQIVVAIKNAGITCIEGNIIVNTSPYGTDCVPHTWSYNDLGNYYACGIWGLNVNENTYELTFDRSAKSNVSLKKIDPYIPELYFNNELELGAANSGDQAYIFCAPYQKQAYIRGSIPSGKGTFSILGSIPDAPKFFSYYLAKALDINGIRSISTAVTLQNITPDKTLWEYDGAPALTQVKSAIEKSINMYCEAFLMELGKGNREKGIKFITNYLKKNKIIQSDKDINLNDGSGLSQRNYISSKVLADFLIYQYKNMPQDKLFSILAKNGYDGTLKNAFLSGGLKGKIHGKSGSMGGVRAYSGFLETKSGKTLSFSIMVNHYTTSSSSVLKEIENLLLEVYRTN